MTTLSPLNASLQRIYGMVLRYVFLLRQSWPRAFETMFWPFLNLLMWGLLTQYLASLPNQYALPISFLLGAAILWEIVLRGGMGTMMPLLEEVWSRTLGHIFISPMRNAEFIAGILSISALRLVIALIPCVLVAWIFFDYQLWALGLPLLGFIINLLLCGWWLGLLICCLLVRYGQSVEWLMWMAIFLIQPLVCVFYPLSTLPSWLQPIALALPPTHVFEGMRAILQHGQVDWAALAYALLLNLAYLGLAIWVFFRSVAATRGRQGLLSYGE